MENLKKRLEEKKAELREIKGSDSKSFCVDVHPSQSQLKRVMRVEELEDEITELQNKLK